VATLPLQVQRDLDRANAQLAQQNEPPAQPATQPALEQPTQRVETAQQQPPAPARTNEPDAETWQQRYRSLQGVIATQNRESKQQIAQLEQRLQELTAAMPRAETQPAPINSQDAETFGEDLVEMVRRTAEGMAGNTIKSLNDRIAQMEQQLAGASAVASKTADEVFYERLAQIVPDWQDVNANEDFLAWLQEVDPMYGLPRQAALTQAGNNRDVNRVAHVFNTWKGTAPQPPKAAPRQEPQVSPRTSGNGAWRVSGGPPSRGWTKAGDHDPERRGVLQGCAAGALPGARG
jgi:hypothetical protein